ncbi:hypothetical protein GCM10010234_39660 [Streptomyces hawaiiensis]
MIAHAPVPAKVIIAECKGGYAEAGGSPGSGAVAEETPDEETPARDPARTRGTQKERLSR